MQRNRHLVVAVLCAHPLLGEGIAKLLALEPGIDVVSASGHDTEAALGTLGAHPDVVIFEPSELLHEIDLPANVPDALLIDVSMGTGPRPAALAKRAGIDEILRVLRRLRAAGARTAGRAVEHAP